MSMLLDWEPEAPADTAPAPQERAVWKAGKETLATKLVQLCEEHYQLGQSSEGKPFAVPTTGPHIARMITVGDQRLRNELSSLYMTRYGSVPNMSALNDALGVIQHRALQQEPTPVYLRIAPIAGGVAIDLGDRTGRAVLVTGDGWTIGEPPVLFRRTVLTDRLPMPQRGGSLDMLRALLNVDDDAWELVRGFLVGSLITDGGLPVGVITGEQGTGKSGATKMLVQLLDPSKAPVRSVPKDERDWIVSSSASQVVALDNVSHIDQQLSDSICKAATGDGLVTRELYTNGEVSYVSIKRTVILNTIGTGSLRGDLADRTVPLRLTRISRQARRTEKELTDSFTQLCPQLLGGLYDLLSATLRVRPTIDLDELPRMADFAITLAALDEATGSHALATYLERSALLSEDVVGSDPVALAVMDLVARNGGVWKGTQTDLYRQLQRPEHVDRKYWPATPHKLRTVVDRAAPAMETLGVTFTDSRTGKGRWLKFEANVALPVPEDEVPF